MSLVPSLIVVSERAEAREDTSLDIRYLAAKLDVVPLSDSKTCDVARRFHAYDRHAERTVRRMSDYLHDFTAYCPTPS